MEEESKNDIRLSRNINLTVNGKKWIVLGAGEPQHTSIMLTGGGICNSSTRMTTVDLRKEEFLDITIINNGKQMPDIKPTRAERRKQNRKNNKN